MTEYVLILSDSYPVYADLDAADEYMAGASHGADWRALTDDADKARYLITATRTLDRQNWKGDKTSDTQELEWPRSDTGVDGVEDDTVPTEIIHASIELALLLVQGSEFQSQRTTEQTIQMLKAGSVSLSYFRGAGGTPTRFPLIVHELIRDYISGPSSSLYVSTSGTDGETITDNDYGLSDGL